MFHITDLSKFIVFRYEDLFIRYYAKGSKSKSPKSRYSMFVNFILVQYKQLKVDKLHLIRD